MEFNKPFQITETAYGLVSVLHISGKIHSGTVSELDRALARLLDIGRNQLVVDLEQVPFLSSAGLRSLLSADRAAQNNGGHVVLAAPQEAVQQVFSMSKLIDVFDVRTTLEEAISSFG